MRRGDTLITWDGTRGRIVSWRHQTEWYTHGEKPRRYVEVKIELPDGRRRFVLPEDIREIRPARGRVRNEEP